MGSQEVKKAQVVCSGAHLGVQFLLHVGAVGCSQKVVEHDEQVSLQVKGQVVAAIRKIFHWKAPLLIPKFIVLVPKERRATWQLQKPQRS